MAAPWLADALRAGGCTVNEDVVPDWRTRGHSDGPFTPCGVLAHHTAGAATGDLPSLAVVRDGRPGLDGPLAQLMLSRDGVYVPIAAGRAWHAGVGSAPFVPNGDGNRYLIGIEAESCGTHDDWTAAQRLAYPLGVAALLRHMGSPASHVLGHLEWALPAGRKTDPAFWDLDVFRTTVAGHLTAPALPAPTPVPRTGAAVTVLGDDMPTVMQAAGRPPVLAVGGLFVELHTVAEQTNALHAYNTGVTAPDKAGVPSPVWIEAGTLADLIGQSQRAVRGAAAT